MKKIATNATGMDGESGDFRNQYWNFVPWL